MLPLQTIIQVMDSKSLLKRPARLQIDPESVEDDSSPQGTVYNIWYQRWSGGDSSGKGRPTSNSPYKVNIARDTGYTKAVESLNICVYFARGCCDRGLSCHYWHRLPTGDDAKIPTQDCFGRDKTSAYQEDMGGVGLFRRYNPTLFVAGLSGLKDLESQLSKAFGEFGPVEKVRVLYGKGCAFIRYRWEVLAQFAKEAMQAQTLGGGEILLIKWAHEDPSTDARKEERDRINTEAMDLVKKLLAEDETKDQEQHEQTDEEEHIPYIDQQEQEHEQESDEDEFPPTKKRKIETQAQSTSFFNEQTLKKLRSANITIPVELLNRIQKILQS